MRERALTHVVDMNIFIEDICSQSVHDLCRRRVLDPNFQDIIKEFTITWQSAVKNLVCQKL